jgi:signal transduction histidine kinase
MAKIKQTQRLFVNFSLAILLFSFFAIAIDYVLKRETIFENSHKIITSYNQNFDQFITQNAKVLQSYIDLVKDNPALYQSFQKRNREALYENTLTLFNNLLKSYDVTHFYFMDLEGRVFLRVHDPKRYSDIVKRYTMSQAMKTHRASWGLEFGLKKNFTLRYVVPWIVNDKHIGYIELGKEIDKIITNLSHKFDIEIYLAIQKSVFKNIPSDLQANLQQMQSSTDYYLTYHTSNIPKTINTLLSKRAKSAPFSFDGEEYINHRQPLYDVSGQELGYTLFLSKHTDEYENLIISTIKYTIGVIGAMFVLVLFSYIMIRSREKEIKTYRQKLEEYNQDLRVMVDHQVEELRQKDSILIEQAKMASMGEMISNIAHQWRQPINTLGLYIQDVKNAYEYKELSDEYIDKMVQTSMNQINYMSKTIDDFQDYLNPNQPSSLIDLSELVDDSYTLVKSSLDINNIMISLPPVGQESMVEVNKGEFQQVLVVLFNNAKDAILARRKQVSDYQGHIEITIKELSDSYQLIFADDAGGIPDTILYKVFEPYFTTKFESRGTGIGLYLAKNSIEKIGGSISVRNGDEGALFAINIPKS